MDFVQILRSLEELLYEVITWIVFYPRTLWRTATAPIATLRYAQRELKDALEEQYADTLSPVVFLMISLGVTHLIGESVSPLTAAPTGRLGQLMSSELNILVTRLVAFAIFPLIYALQELRRARRPLDRNTLRAPFYGQCFITAVFALFLGLCITAVRIYGDSPVVVRAALFAGPVLWYVGVQARWLHVRHGVRPAVAAGLAVYGFVTASIIVLLALIVLSITRGPVDVSPA